MCSKVDIAFYSDGIKHAGVLFAPESATYPAPAVVVCHGYGGTMSFIVADIAERLAQLGYIAMIFDYRGFGRSEGTRHRLIPQEQVQDIIDAVTFLKSREEVDPDRIGLFGTSFGGANVICAAARDKRVKATVSSIGFSDGEEWLRSLRPYWSWMQFLLRLEKDAVRHVTTGKSEIVHPDEIMVRDPESEKYNAMLLEKYPDREFSLPLETAQRIVEFKPIDSVARISPRALLIIRAEDDALMPEWHARDLYAAALEPKEFVLIPSAEHHEVYAGPLFDRLMDAVAEFLNKHLRSKR